MTNCTPRESKRKQPANDFLMSHCSSNHTLTLTQWRKPRWRLCLKVRNKDLSTSSCAWMALLGQFREAENKTGSFNETAGYRSCRSPLELSSMWSLRVTNFTQQVRRRSGWRVARGVDQKFQKTENNVYRWQCTIQGFTAMHYTVKS